MRAEQQRMLDEGTEVDIIWATVRLAAIAVWSGRYADAALAAQEAVERAEQMGGRFILATAWARQAAVAAYTGREADARAAARAAIDAAHEVEALERNGERHDRPWMLAMRARGRGHMLAARGDLEGAQRAVEYAMVHHQRLPVPFEAAHTQLLLGQLQRRRRRRQDSAASLRALEVFERLGTPWWASRARAELARLDSPRWDGQGLTASEQRVAELAATGSSNKQIAAKLFIAEKTVEMNLGRAYRKLGVRSRSGLSPALRSQDA